MRKALAIYLGCALLAAWAILRAWDHLRGRQEVYATRYPRHLDPAICHAGWCPTTRTGRPDDCDCTAEWIAA